MPRHYDTRNIAHRFLASLLDRNLVKLLLKNEIIAFPLATQPQIECWSGFTDGGADLTEIWMDALHRRIIQHNIRVVAKYYKEIHGARLAQLLRLAPDRLEREIAIMVSEGSIYAKIDRPKDIVRFAASKNPEAVLTDWASDIDELLHLVETTTHLINKEVQTAS
jgi:26S proteasome regulatory subunit N5